MVNKVLFALLSGVLLGCGFVSCSQQADVASVANMQPLEINQRVLEAIERMPSGGGYSLTPKTMQGLREAITLDSERGSLSVSARRATPSFCSSATYLVLLEVLERSMDDGVLSLSLVAQRHLASVGHDDGVGVWGRWNANGPGAARLFKQLRCGRNFTEYSSARAGDFMKIWWTEEIGAKEHGHLVVFLGVQQVDGVEYVRFWSSNTPQGYGEKMVPKSRVKRVLFSRLADLHRFNRVSRLPREDRFLAKMLRKRYRWSTVRRKCAAQP